MKGSVIMYFILLGVGAGFILISLLVGEFADVEGSAFFSFLRPTLVAVFMVVCGGIGLMLTPRFAQFGGGGIVFVASVLGGLFVAGLINRFVIIPLHRAQNTSAYNIQDTIGKPAKIISPIPQGGYGKISFSMSGSVVTSPAKSEDGNPIPCGENVEIIYIEKNTYFVRKKGN